MRKTEMEIKENTRNRWRRTENGGKKKELLAFPLSRDDSVLFMYCNSTVADVLCWEYYYKQDKRFCQNVVKSRFFER
jgi:hypothetical protein